MQVRLLLLAGVEVAGMGSSSARLSRYIYYRFDSTTAFHLIPSYESIKYEGTNVWLESLEQIINRHYLKIPILGFNYLFCFVSDIFFLWIQMSRGPVW